MKIIIIIATFDLLGKCDTCISFLFSSTNTELCCDVAGTIMSWEDCHCHWLRLFRESEWCGRASGLCYIHQFAPCPINSQLLGWPMSCLVPSYTPVIHYITLASSIKNHIEGYLWAVECGVAGFGVKFDVLTSNQCWAVNCWGNHTAARRNEIAGILMPDLMPFHHGIILTMWRSHSMKLELLLKVSHFLHWMFALVLYYLYTYIQQ